jgi:pimeloyl-ACP methyl ester carboxylesterase
VPPVPTVELNGIDLYYERTGEGAPLLFLNGSGATVVSSAALIAPFTRCFDVVAHDQRGLGRTSIPPGPYTMADYAADAAALLDRIGWPSCRVVGVSFGGMVAQELAVTWPERIGRLALLCTSPGGAGGASYPLHELATLAADERAAVSQRLLDTRFTADWLATHDTDRLLAEAIASRRAADDAEHARGAREQLEARRHHDVWDRLERISCPTLVAAGRFDGIAPVANATAIASRIPGAQLRVYEGGHLFMAQDAAALPAVIDFLRVGA